MKATVLATLLALPVAPLAADPPAAEPAAARLPDALTEGERGEMIEAANAYGECLLNEAGRREDEPDPRAIADAAMGACSGRLDSLQALLAGLQLDPGYAEAFKRQTRDRAARRLLGLLMQLKGGAAP